MEETDWSLAIKAKRRQRTLKACLFVVAVEVLWLGLFSSGVWVWVVIFHQLPPGRLMLDALAALGTVIVIPLAALAPLAPIRGKDPEVMAADEFFKGPPR